MSLSLTLKFFGFPTRFWGEEHELLRRIQAEVAGIWNDAGGCEIHGALCEDHRSTSSNVQEAIWIEGTYAQEEYEGIPQGALDVTAGVIHRLLLETIADHINTPDHLKAKTDCCGVNSTPHACRFAKVQVTQLGNPNQYGLRQGPIAA